MMNNSIKINKNIKYYTLEQNMFTILLMQDKYEKLKIEG